MAFITDAELRTELAARMKLPTSASLESHWSTVATRANSAAYQEILGKLVPRGYTKAQVDTWVRGAEFNVDIGLYWCLVHGGVAHDYPDKFINKLDRRAELDTVILLDTSGVEIEPVGGIDEVGYGNLNTGDDMFVMPLAADDARIGETMEI